MKHRIFTNIYLLIAGLFTAIILASGCSGNTESPQIPGGISDNQQLANDLPLPGLNENNSGRDMLGEWTAVFDLDSLTATVQPDRDAAIRFNITTYLPTPIILIKDYNSVTGIVDVNVTVKNIINIDGYDLRFIVFNNRGHQLKNADDWTSAYDPPGGLPINPFKAYAKDQSERIFQASAQYTENLKIFLPGGNPNVKFAIDAAYPTHSAEPYQIEGFYQETLLQTAGSSANVWTEVHDWQNDISSVSLYCPEITGTELVDFSEISPNNYQLNLVNNTGASAANYMAVIVATSGGQTLYDVATIKVSKINNTIGLTKKLPGTFNGYTLFCPMSYNMTYLIDTDGNIVHSWTHDGTPNSSVYLLENGNLLHTIKGDGISSGGGVEEFDWDGNLIWKYKFAPGLYTTHHDIERLPNGNTLFVVIETKNLQECIDAGRDPSKIPDGKLTPDAIIEVKPTGPTSGDIVWEWHPWDHLSSTLGGTANGHPVSTDITDPGKLNINFMLNSGADWLHTNSVYYNKNFDQVIISLHQISEVVVIDHSTANYDDPASGIEAAQGEAGDLIYRWGNPRAYGRGDLNSQTLFQMHNPYWIEDGLPGAANILVFNNGGRRNYTSVDEFVPPVDAEGNYSYTPGTAFGPTAAIWTYTATPPSSWYVAAISSAQRLPNGNTLICSGLTGNMFEVTYDKQIVWQYINPVTTSPQKQGSTINGNLVFRCLRYAPDYPGLAGRDLTPQGPVELPAD